MKLYKILGIVALLLFVVTSCDNDLESIEPQQAISGEAALSDPDLIENVLVGAYFRARTADAYGGIVQVMADLYGSSDEVNWNGTFSQPREIFNKDIIVDNSYVGGNWRISYKIIGMANLVLEHSDIIEDETRRREINGQALFLRALAHFDLVRNFGVPYEIGGANNGLGVPLVTDAITDFSVDLLVPRNTVAEVYAQVVADLNEAFNLLPAVDNIFADRYAARGLLARVYLQQGNYAAARDAAHDVITNSGHTLTGNFAQAFNNASNSPEDVFAFQSTIQDGRVNWMVTHYADQPSGGRGFDISINNAYLELFDDPDDDRANFFYQSAQNPNRRLTSKHVDPTATENNISLIRLAEMYLIRAECNFRLGSSIGNSPLADINLLRNRANAQNLSSVDLNTIILERRLELAFEGHLIHDIKRTQGSVFTIESGGQVVVIPYNHPRMTFPIPLREIQINPNLIQNTGY
jgi:hypothetical protein